MEFDYYLSEGDKIPLVMKTNSRAKRLVLRYSLKDRNFRLTVPPRVSQAQVKVFLDQSKPWVYQQLEERKQIVSFAPGAKVTIHGESFVCTSDPLRCKPALCSTTQTLHLPPKAQQKDIYALFKKVAAETLKPLLDQALSALEQDIEKMTIRDTRTRWGSCSPRRTISLNWRLILAPPEVAEYVCIHEAAHLIHMNHSHAFWNVVEGLCPNYKIHRKWLRSHGRSLMEV